MTAAGGRAEGMRSVLEVGRTGRWSAEGRDMKWDKSCLTYDGGLHHGNCYGGLARPCPRASSSGPC